MRAKKDLAMAANIPDCDKRASKVESSPIMCQQSKRFLSDPLIELRGGTSWLLLTPESKFKTRLCLMCMLVLILNHEPPSHVHALPAQFWSPDAAVPVAAGTS